MRLRVGLATALDELVGDADDVALLAALRAAGHDGALVAWREPDVAWDRLDAVVVRSTWDYQQRRDAFVAWARRVGEATLLCNDAEVVRWNTHKGYLLELEERGAPVVPTAWLAQGDRVGLAALAASRDWRRVVVKPAVGAGGEGVLLLDPASGQAALDVALAVGDVLVQPYLASVATTGELSVVVIDGEVTHAVRKVPAEGGFLVQSQHGGRCLPVVPVPAEAAALARWVVEVAGHDLLYARVDLVADDAGAWQLSELEATEPSLFLDAAPGAAARLVAGIERRAGRAVSAG